jgi:hypothetical protein
MSVAQRPRILFFGAGDLPVGSAVILQSDTGRTDNDRAFATLAVTNSITTAIPSQEVLCYATYVTLLHAVAAPVIVTVQLYVDQRDPIERTFTVPATTRAQLNRYEIGWAERVGTGAQVTQTPRGYRLRVGVTAPALDDADLLEIHGIECEAEVMAEGISPANSA